MRSEDGRVSRQVVEIVHDDSHEKVQHDEWTEENERYKVDVRQRRTTVLVWVEQFTYKGKVSIAILWKKVYLSSAYP